MTIPPAPIPGIGGLILCGGRSSRMGRDKAGLRFGPQTLLERLALRVAAVTAPVVVALAPWQAPPALPTDYLPVRDPAPDQGPLFGLVAGFRRLAGEADGVVVLPVDLPFLSEEWIVRLAHGLEGVRAAAFRYEGYVNALTAAYRLDLLPTLEQIEREGERRPMRLLAAARPRVIAVEEIWRPGAGPSPLMDVDTPEDYRQALLWEGFGNPRGVPVTAEWGAGGGPADLFPPLPLFAATAEEALRLWTRIYPETAETARELRRRGGALVVGAEGKERTLDWETRLAGGQRVRFVNG